MIVGAMNAQREAIVAAKANSMSTKRSSPAARSWGILKLPSDTLKDLFEHEDGFLDA
jgi:hypothetical protein